MREKTKKLRADVIKAARQEFAARGYAEASIQKIADVAKIGQTALLFHFKTKQILFTEVVNDIIHKNVEMFEASTKDEHDARERLVNYFKVNAKWAIEMRQHAQIMTTVYHFGTFDKKFAQLYQAVLNGARGKIRGFILAGQREKLFKSNIDVEQITEILHDFILGCLINIGATQGSKTLTKKAEEKWIFLTDSLLSK